MTKAYIGIGSNLGDKKANITKAITLLSTSSQGDSCQGDDPRPLKKSLNIRIVRKGVARYAPTSTKATFSAVSNRSPDTRVLRVAPLYRTAPLGYTRQDWFINTVAELETILPPLELLELLLAIENEMGRRRRERWGPRIIDLDLLLYGEVAMDAPKLTLPHPRMHERAFVMAPLADLAPQMNLPGYGRAVELARKLKQEQAIEPC